LPTAVLKCPADEVTLWRDAFHFSMPDLDLQVYPDFNNKTKIEYALISEPPEDLFERCRNIKLIFSLAAGVNHLLQVGELPIGMSVVRLVDPALTMGMSEYLLYQVLRFHRRMPQYEQQQQWKEWQELTQMLPQQRKVGIMGLGELGGDIAEKLAYLDFNVAGWSLSFKKLSGVECFVGKQDFFKFLQRTEILICLLPLTPQTRGILNSECFANLPANAYLINVGRGGHLVEQDLLDALGSGQLAGAALDVFSTEPLPADHVFWSHPNITITPHVASITNPMTAAAIIAANIRRHINSEPIKHIVNTLRGY